MKLITQFFATYAWIKHSRRFDWPMAKCTFIHTLLRISKVNEKVHD